jgi:V8-like Glu-specific endopeptidase
MTVWDDARSLIGDGEIDIALDLVEAFLKGRLDGPLTKRARPLLDTVIMLRARGRRLTTSSIKGVLTVTDAEIERARRDQSVLDLIGEAARMDNLRVPVAAVDLPNRTVSEKLMGAESQLRSIGWLAEGLRLASAVCRLTDDATIGSGFRCRDDAVITNHHVIGARDAAAKFRAEFFFEEDADRKLRAPVSIALDPQRLFWTSEKLDVTLIGLPKISRDDIAIIPLSSNDAKIDDHVSIIQHPNGGPKQIAVTNNRIVNIFDPYVQYMTDTLPGSSGSPVFLDSWRVVAIHHAGGNVRKNTHGDVIFANEGILITALLFDINFLAAYSTAEAHLGVGRK